MCLAGNQPVKRPSVNIVVAVVLVHHPNNHSALLTFSRGIVGKIMRLVQKSSLTATLLQQLPQITPMIAEEKSPTG